MYVSKYIYIEREREREREDQVKGVVNCESEKSKY